MLDRRLLLGAALALTAAALLSLSGPGAQAQNSLLPRLRCAMFPTELETGKVIETSDRTTEIGQWVAAQEEDDWQLYQVDFETAQKPTGYPQGWVQVCMTPR